MNVNLAMIIMIVLCVAILALLPIISIWALNTLFVGVLFNTAIELNLWTYLAMLWFGGILGAGAKAINN